MTTYTNPARAVHDLTHGTHEQQRAARAWLQERGEQPAAEPDPAETTPSTTEPHRRTAVELYRARRTPTL